MMSIVRFNVLQLYVKICATNMRDIWYAIIINIVNSSWRLLIYLQCLCMCC